MAGPTQDWREHPAAPDIEAVVVREMPPLAPALEAEVNRLWQQARRQVPTLFNGRIFSADAITPSRLTGHWSEYRRLVAQFLEPALFEQLQVRSLAVCGLVRCADGLVLGRRGAGSVYQSGQWQVVPAGNVDQQSVRDGRIDLRAQLLRELQEELGVAAACVSGLRPLCLVEHPGSAVFDMAYALRVPLSAAGVLAAHAASGNDEMSELRIVADDAIEATIEALGGSLMGLARLLLRRQAAPQPPGAIAQAGTRSAGTG